LRGGWGERNTNSGKKKFTREKHEKKKKKKGINRNLPYKAWGAQLAPEIAHPKTGKRVRPGLQRWRVPKKTKKNCKKGDGKRNRDDGFGRARQQRGEGETAQKE